MGRRQQGGPGRENPLPAALAHGGRAGRVAGGGFYRPDPLLVWASVEGEGYDLRKFLEWIAFHAIGGGELSLKPEPEEGEGRMILLNGMLTWMVLKLHLSDGKTEARETQKLMTRRWV